MLYYISLDDYMESLTNNKKKKKEFRDSLFTTISKIPVIPSSKLREYQELNNYIETRFTDGEYTFDIIRKALKTDSYARLRMEKYTMLSTVRGYSFIGPDEQKAKIAIDFLHEEINRIEQSSGVLFDSLIDDIFYSLFGFSNCFIHVIRGEKVKPYTVFNKTYTKSPSRYEVIDLMNNEMTIIHDEFGNIKGYRQYIFSGNRLQYGRTYLPDEIIFIKVFPEKLFGRPVLSSVIDDIRMLRRLEENMILQSFQYSIPPLVYKVKPANPASPIAEDPNIINAKRELEELQAHGGIVTTSDAEIEIPVPSSLLEITKYLEYAKQRVLSGLYLSTIAVGEGSTANKATANVMFDDIINHAKYHQKVVASYVNKFIINDLLSSSKYKSVNSYVNKIKLSFPEIDISYYTTLANQEILLYNSGLVSRNEVRNKINYGPMSEHDKKDTVHVNNSYDNISTTKEVMQKTMPENQYSRKLTSTKRARVNDNLDLDTVETIVDGIIRSINNANMSDDAKEYIVTKLKNMIAVSKDQINIKIRNGILNDILDLSINIMRILNASDESKTQITIDQIRTYI